MKTIDAYGRDDTRNKKGAGQGAPNVQEFGSDINALIGSSMRPDPMQIATGAGDADALLLALRANLTHGNELHGYIRMQTGRGDDWLYGFFGRLQKALERGR